MARISWEKLSDYIEHGIPAVLPVLKCRGASLVVGRNAGILALRLPFDGASEIEPSPYRELTFEFRSVKGKRIIELSTARQELFQSFYVFAMAVVDTMADSGIDAGAAIRNSLDKFDIMLMRRPLLSEQIQIGLFGELSLLEELIQVNGTRIFSSWLGPLKERHDFRFNGNELEVKSTTGRGRVHIIHGLDQLELSPGKRLWLLSLKYERAGAGSGRTLPEQIAVVRLLLRRASGCLRAFNGHLEHLGYRDGDAYFYATAYQPSGNPVLIEVNDDCPRLTRQMLERSHNRGLSSRVDDVEYRLNVEGLGCAEGSTEYKRVLPGVSFIKKGKDHAV